MKLRQCEQILHAYGAPFLQYVFALDDQTVTLELLAKQEQSILEELRTVAVNASLDGTFEIDVSWNAMRHFLPRGNSRIGRAAQLRKLAGGEPLVIPTTDDPFLTMIIELATIFWPGIALLKGWQDSVHRFGISNGVRSHGSDIGDATALALLQDDHLAMLFPSPDPETLRYAPSVVSCDWSLSADPGGQVTTTVGQVIDQMLQISAVRLEARESSWKFENYCTRLTETVRDFRRLARGKSALFPVVVGIAGLTGEGFERMSFDAHTLRKSSALGSHLLSRFGSGSHMLTLEIPTRLLACKFVTPAQRAKDKRYEDLAAIVENETNVIRLAILLGANGTSRVATTRLFTRFLTPRGPGAVEIWSASNFENFQRSDGQVLAPSDASNIPEVYRTLKPRLDELHNSTMAVRRLLQAAGNRTSSIDSFIDAFIAIESLLSPGAGTKKLTDKLSTAVGILLESSDEQQDEVTNELKDLYLLRSNIVHGNRRTPNDLVSESQRAVEFACRIMSAICFEEEPDFRFMGAPRRNARLQDRRMRPV